jgi:hypothetical protein
MKKILYILLILPLIFACKSVSKSQPGSNEMIIFESLDNDILSEVLELLSAENDAPTASLMVKAGLFFKETPYIANTLETSPEQLVINLREMDCTTFAENCLAIAKTIQSGQNTFEKFASELKNIRYRDGKINGYTSRLHYFSDWIYNNQKKRYLKDISMEIANTPYNKVLNFMSTHPASYKQLKDSSQLVQTIAIQEKEISARKMYYVPETKISEIENQLKEGDIVGITTSIAGLDVAHVGILIRIDGHIHLLHASSLGERVIVSKETLEEYLLNSKSATGIMVARPL